MATNSESSVRIIPFFSQPHVHTVIRDNTYYDETVYVQPDNDSLPYSTCIVTGADTGIDNTFVRISDLETKKAIFGNGNFRKYGQSSIQADVLFNGSTNVWFCRVLPDNATYSNMIVLAHYRKGPVLNESNQETGLNRLEIKFSTVSASKPFLQEGAKTELDIEQYANSLIKDTVDAVDGYMTIPLFYVRSTGRGKYGNGYSIAVTRDTDAEKEYGMKMYRFTLIENGTITKKLNEFVGSLYQTTRYDMSTLIQDVIDQYPTGSAPVNIYSFEDNYLKLYDFYKDIIAENATVIAERGADDLTQSDLKDAMNIIEDTFDPLFGLKLQTQTGESMPFYKNYTVTEAGPYVEPEYTVPDDSLSTKPLNLEAWPEAFVGARVLVVADANKEGKRWIYTVTDIQDDNIIYDDGVESAIDEDQYDGTNLSISAGNPLYGGHDGDFQEISVNGETRQPTEAEMKILLSREYVKAFRGLKDRKILSPSRVNLDFIFDANYNMTTNVNVEVDASTAPLYSGSTVLTDKDYQNLAVLGTTNIVMDYNDLNVKKAMYDLNEFRNRNGMNNPGIERGAGCSLYLDCGITGNKSIDINYELRNLITTMEEFEGRATSIDLGYYDIFDPTTRRRVQVTVAYFLAKNLIPHIMRQGMNVPFVYNDAQLTSLQRDANYIVTGQMIRDSFHPDIDMIDWDVKEKLYTSRINYYLTSEEGRLVQRACQNTRQMEASALLEENNVRVLNSLKKGLEKACRSYLYKWNEPEVRKGYTDAQMDIYRPWIGTYVQDLQIKFEADEWEQERMMMHCYVIVKFRDIAKRIILEINIQRPEYSSGGEA